MVDKRSMIAAAITDLSTRALSPNTLKSYASAMRQYARWSATSSQPDLFERCPEPSKVLAYLAHLHRANKSLSTAHLFVSAVSHQARQMHLPTPIGEEAKKVLAGMRQSSLEESRQAYGLQWPVVDLMAKRARADGTLAGLRDSALLRLGSDAMLRISELAAVHVKHLKAETDGSGRLIIPRAKSRANGHSDMLFIGEPTMAELTEWLEGGKLIDGLVFRSIRMPGEVLGNSLSSRAIHDIIKNRAKELGVEEPVSGHSLRVGSAQSLAIAGASLVDMQMAGRWKSPTMPAHYARAARADQGAIARLKYQH